MPPVFGPWSPSSRRLWSCALGITAIRCAVAEGQYRELLAFQPLLDHQLAAGRAEHAAAQQFVHQAYRLGRRVRQEYTLAGGEARSP